MKKLLFLALTLVSISFVSLDAQTVYVTKTGTKYHEETCSYLRYSKFFSTLTKAIEYGYTACSRCHPPKLNSSNNSTITYNYNTKKSYKNQSTHSRMTYSVRCSGITQSGRQCKRRTKNSSGYCWQH